MSRFGRAEQLRMKQRRLNPFFSYYYSGKFSEASNEKEPLDHLVRDAWIKGQFPPEI